MHTQYSRKPYFVMVMNHFIAPSLTTTWDNMVFAINEERSTYHDDGVDDGGRMWWMTDDEDDYEGVVDREQG